MCTSSPVTQKLPGNSLFQFFFFFKPARSLYVILLIRGKKASFWGGQKKWSPFVKRFVQAIGQSFSVIFTRLPDIPYNCSGCAWCEYLGNDNVHRLQIIFQLIARDVVDFVLQSSILSQHAAVPAIHYTSTYFILVLSNIHSQYQRCRLTAFEPLDILPSTNWLSWQPWQDNAWPYSWNL